MDNWDEIRTAFNVARLGTVSGAAEALGVHHATVIRHIDALEGRLGVKLFQRHARGYTPTEAGSDLMQVAQATDDQFSQLQNRIRGRGDDVSGELVLTSLPSMSPLVTPTLVEFQQMYPGLIIRYLTGARLFRLEYGEAHVAIRAGSPPDQPDNVVQPFGRLMIGLYASHEYIRRKGKPKDETEFAGHDFVCADEKTSRAPFNRWLWSTVAEDQIVFRNADNLQFRDAVLAGAGIGFMAEWDAQRCSSLVEVIAPREDWSAACWLVTHVDLHRTTKVQTFLKFLKEEAKDWQIGL
jgi:DNA-binding transcriptional LysR family regulator